MIRSVPAATGRAGAKNPVVPAMTAGAMRKGLRGVDGPTSVQPYIAAAVKLMPSDGLPNTVSVVHSP
jgi:hypothetical protein